MQSAGGYFDETTMNDAAPVYNPPPFNEDTWIRLIFLLSDTQRWMNEIALNALMQVPMQDRKKLFRKTYYIGVIALAHIIERHYFKIPRHPETGKFTIPMTELLCYLRDAFNKETTPVPGSLHFRRFIDTGNVIGFDENHLPTTIITILTDSGGCIITAFPGAIKNGMK